MKYLNCIKASMLILISTILVLASTTVFAYEEEGYLSSRPPHDNVSYKVQVNGPGIMIICLKKNADLYATLLNVEGSVKSHVESKPFFEKDMTFVIDLSEEKYPQTKPGYFRITITAVCGEGSYKLQAYYIMKDANAIKSNSNLYNVSLLTIYKHDKEDFLVVWNKGEDELSTVSIALYDSDLTEEVFYQKTAYSYFWMNHTVLPNGYYKLGVERQGKSEYNLDPRVYSSNEMIPLKLLNINSSNSN